MKRFPTSFAKYLVYAHQITLNLTHAKRISFYIYFSLSTYRLRFVKTLFMLHVAFKNLWRPSTLCLLTCSGSVLSSARRTDTRLCRSPPWRGISGSHRWSAGRSFYGSSRGSWRPRCWCTPCCTPPARHRRHMAIESQIWALQACIWVSVCKNGLKTSEKLCFKEIWYTVRDTEKAAHCG